MQTALEPPATTRGAPHSMSVFSLVDAETLRKTVESLSSSTCELDILPTSFLKSVIHITTDLLRIINTSLLTGTFPSSLKTAVLKPLLKKITSMPPF